MFVLAVPGLDAYKAKLRDVSGTFTGLDGALLDQEKFKRPADRKEGELGRIVGMQTRYSQY